MCNHDIILENAVYDKLQLPSSYFSMYLYMAVHLEARSSEAEKPSIYIRFPELVAIPPEGFPHHIFIIPDGNRRFAKAEGKEAIAGHQQGLENTLSIFRDLRELSPIRFVTLWAFSDNNWSRPAEEVDGLMNLLAGGIEMHIHELDERNVRLIHLGRKDRIPQALQDALANAEERTHANTGQTLSLGIDFGGQDQDFREKQRLARDIEYGLVTADTLSETFLHALRDGDGMVPPADLLIRTSGETRLSDPGWLVGANTELYFTDKLFPQTTTKDIIEAIVAFSQRNRRMGK